MIGMELYCGIKSLYRTFDCVYLSEGHFNICFKFFFLFSFFCGWPKMSCTFYLIASYEWHFLPSLSLSIFKVQSTTHVCVCVSLCRFWYFIWMHFLTSRFLFRILFIRRAHAVYIHHFYIKCDNTYFLYHNLLLIL